jgi:hypothetical protein
MEAVSKYLVMDKRTKTRMEFVDPISALSEEEAAKRAITVLGFGYTSVEKLKTRTAVDILDSLGHYVEKVEK